MHFKNRPWIHDMNSMHGGCTEGKTPGNPIRAQLFALTDSVEEHQPDVRQFPPAAFSIALLRVVA